MFKEYHRLPDLIYDRERLVGAPYASDPREDMCDRRVVLLCTPRCHSVLSEYLMIPELESIARSTLDSDARSDTTQDDGVDLATTQPEIEVRPVECSPLALRDDDVGRLDIEDIEEVCPSLRCIPHRERRVAYRLEAVCRDRVDMHEKYGETLRAKRPYESDRIIHDGLGVVGLGRHGGDAFLEVDDDEGERGGHGREEYYILKIHRIRTISHAISHNITKDRIISVNHTTPIIESCTSLQYSLNVFPNCPAVLN